MKKFIIGQRVILTGQGNIKEIGRVVPPEHDQFQAREGYSWVYSPTNKYASQLANHNIEPLPRGQL
jgi:hypothetical protein